MNLEVQIPGGVGGSSRAGSAISGRSATRLADRWEYVTTPPPKAWTEHVLESKLRPRESGLAPPRVKRESSEDPLMSGAILKNRRTSTVCTQRSVPEQVNRPAGTPETNTLAVEAKRLCPPGKGVAREDSGPTIQKESAISQLSRQNELLKREIDLLNIHRDHKIVSLEETILRLQDRNKELRRMLFRRRDIDELVTEKYNSSSDVILGLTQKLDQKDQEIESKIDQIASLDDQLGAQEWLIRTVEDLECDFTCSSNFSKGLAELNQGARRIAGLLAQCLSRSAIQRVWKKPSKENGFHTFIKSTLRTVRPLDSNPVEGMRALIFAFVRDRIFLSNCWGALHFEGYMLRQLQQFIQKTGPSGTLESLHRASIEAMLAGDHQFEHCWMKKEMENTRLQFLELLRPITDAGELEEIKHHVERDLGSLFTDAFKVRARFVPPTRCRYQIMQFKPGDFFDPDYMEIDAATAKDNATVPSSSSQKIKFCIHGCLLEHSSSVTEDSGTEVPHSLSRPFIQNDEHISPTGKGILKGDKAIVILEH